MNLFVDLKEISLIPFSELETQYVSSIIDVGPNGKRIYTKSSFGNKFVTFHPHKFNFLIEDEHKSILTITVCGQYSTSERFPISYVQIPIKAIPVEGYASVNLKTVEIKKNINNTPIVKIVIGINPKNVQKELNLEEAPMLKVIKEIDYSKCEESPEVEMGQNGKMKPPNHYMKKFQGLFEHNKNLFMELLADDKMRETVLENVEDYYLRRSREFDGKKYKIKASNKHEKYFVENIQFQSYIDSYFQSMRQHAEQKTKRRALPTAIKIKDTPFKFLQVTPNENPFLLQIPPHVLEEANKTKQKEIQETDFNNKEEELYTEKFKRTKKTKRINTHMSTNDIKLSPIINPKSEEFNSNYQGSKRIPYRCLQPSKLPKLFIQPQNRSSYNSAIVYRSYSISKPQIKPQVDPKEI